MVRKFSLILFCLILIFPAISQAERSQQTLILMLDGVSYRIMKELQEEKQTYPFENITKVISTFPSVTVSDLTGVLIPAGSKKSLGYNHIYYSYKDNKINGSMFSALKTNQDDFITYFNYYRQTFWSNLLMFLTPGLSAKNDLTRSQKMIWHNPEQKVFNVYVGGTDGSAHVLGRTRQKRLLRFIFDRLQILQNRYVRAFGKKLNIVIFSDHGFRYSHLKSISTSKVKKHLKTNGYKFSHTLNDSKSVVAIEWGNISGAEFYTKPESTESVASILKDLAGIELIFYRTKDYIGVFNKDGEQAKIYSNQNHSKFRYSPIKGDPLRYKPVVHILKQKNKLDKWNFAHEKSWFDLTKNLTYPDVPYRIYSAFYGLVQNPATILLSTRTNYEYGNTLTRFLTIWHGNLKGTHGAIFQDASDAFFSTNMPDLKAPDIMRFDEIDLLLKQHSIHLTKN